MDPLPPPWRGIYDSYKRESRAYYKALLAIHNLMQLQPGEESIPKERLELAQEHARRAVYGELA